MTFQVVGAGNNIFSPVVETGPGVYEVVMTS